MSVDNLGETNHLTVRMCHLIQPDTCQTSELCSTLLQLPIYLTNIRKQTFPMIARPSEPFAPHSSFPTRSSRLRRSVLIKVVVICPFAALSVWIVVRLRWRAWEEAYPELIPYCLWTEQRGIAGIMSCPGQNLGMLTHCRVLVVEWGPRLGVRYPRNDPYLYIQWKEFGRPNSEVYTDNRAEIFHSFHMQWASE